MKPIFFRSPAAFRKWLRQHAATRQELLVGFYKTDSGSTPAASGLRERQVMWPDKQVPVLVLFEDERDCRLD
jgi:hypothetical protein